MDPLLSDYYNVQCFGAQIRLQSPSIELVDARPAQPCCLTQPSLVKLLSWFALSPHRSTEGFMIFNPGLGPSYFASLK